MEKLHQVNACQDGAAVPENFSEDLRKWWHRIKVTQMMISVINCADCYRKNCGVSQDSGGGKNMGLRVAQDSVIILLCVWPNKAAFWDDSYHIDWPTPG